MPGPPPKAARLRQRTNKVSTTATLPPDGHVPTREMPPLPVRECRPCDGVGKFKAEGAKQPTPCTSCAGSGVWDWHERTQAMWARLWRSPMAGEYVEADIDRAFIMADLVDRYWWGETELAAEIRLQGQCFGTSPLDRRRLQWEIGKVEEQAKRRPPQEAPAGRGKRRAPLSYLRAVK